MSEQSIKTAWMRLVELHLDGRHKPHFTTSISAKCELCGANVSYSNVYIWRDPPDKYGYRRGHKLHGDWRSCVEELGRKKEQPGNANPA